MSTFVIGQGILDKMASFNDSPRSDELTVEGTGMPSKPRISVAYGRDAVYYYFSEDNRTVRLPFE